MDGLEQSQLGRLVDVFVVGPGLIWLSLNRKLSVPERVFLMVTGLGAIGYNGYRYSLNSGSVQGETAVMLPKDSFNEVVG